MWEWAGARQGGTAASSLVPSSDVALLVGRPEERCSELPGHPLGFETQAALLRGRGI